MISVSGIGSGLDIESIVTQLVAAEGQPASVRLDRKETDLQARLSALGVFKGSLSELQSSLSSLKDLASFNARLATTSNDDVFTVSASSTAAVGAYDISVTQLAQTHKIASTGYTNSTDTVGTGTLSFRFGSYDPSETTFTPDANIGTKVVVIDSTTSTLEGIRESVNNADIGVRASIVNDGNGNRLVFSSENSGAGNALEVTVADDDGNDSDTNGLSNLTFSATTKNMSTTVTAQDAQLTIDGIDVTRSSNTVTDAVEGLTLSLKATGSVTATVDLDTGKTKNTIEEFVQKFNALVGTIKDLAGYNAETAQGGALLGDATVRGVESQLRRIIGQRFSTSGPLQSLADLGVTTARDGKLQINDSKLQNALDNHFEEIAGLFAAYGKPSDPLIRYVSHDANTKPGIYAIELSQFGAGSPATSGFYGGSAVSLPIRIDSRNDRMRLQVDGVQSGNIRLTRQTYNSGAALAAEMQAKINADGNLSGAGKSVVVTFESNRFVITSNSTGAGSSVEITQVDPDMPAELGINAGVGTPGEDAISAGFAGTIGGFSTTTDTNGGFFMTGSGGASGLKVEVRGGGIGVRGNVVFTRGIGEQLDAYLTSILNSQGPIDSKTTGMNASIDDINDQRDDLARRLESLEARYRAQFSALDAMVAQFNSTSIFLSQQLAGLANLANTGNDN